MRFENTEGRLQSKQFNQLTDNFQISELKYF